jgi:hypothetical protein
MRMVIGFVGWFGWFTMGENPGLKLLNVAEGLGRMVNLYNF